MSVIKKLAALAVAGTCWLQMSADYTAMVFTTTDNATHAIALDGLQINFVGTDMVATGDGATLTLPLATLASMEFGDKSTSGIGEIIATSAPVPVTVYTVDGVAAGRFESMSAALTSLATGTYIIKTVNGQTAKIVITK